MKIIKFSSVVFLILSYLALTMMLIYGDRFQDSSIPAIFIIWTIGAVNYALNFTYCFKVGMKDILVMLFGISGIVWIFPPLLFTFFGIPFLAIYLGIGMYLHMVKGSALMKK